MGGMGKVAQDAERWGKHGLENESPGKKNQSVIKQKKRKEKKIKIKKIKQE